MRRDDYDCDCDCDDGLDDDDSLMILVTASSFSSSLSALDVVEKNQKTKIDARHRREVFIITDTVAYLSWPLLSCRPHQGAV